MEDGAIAPLILSWDKFESLVEPWLHKLGVAYHVDVIADSGDLVVADLYIKDHGWRLATALRYQPFLQNGGDYGGTE